MYLKNKIRKFFNNTTPIVGLTAYSYDMAKILDKYVAGIALQGTEVKSVRIGEANLKEAYCFFSDNYLFFFELLGH